MPSSSSLMSAYGRLDLSFDRGEGAWLYATNGRRYLDFATGIAVTALGHAHPSLIKALTDQAGKLWHCSNLFRIPGQEKLAERLCARSFADQVFFTNSGTEALEACLKLARRAQYLRNDGPTKWRTIVARNAFHGRSQATIAAGGQEKHTKGFEPLTPGFDHVPYGDPDAAAAAITPETGAILVEPIQGEGGIRPAPEGYLAALRALADENDLILIYDEVQTGMGRTGSLFAYEQLGPAPDIMALAKGIGGGFPLGACLATAEVGQAFSPGTHGSTYGGNPLAMAVGNAVMDVMDEPGFMDNVKARAAQLRSGLEDLIATHQNGPVASVRGLGLLMGLVCRAPNTDVLTALRDAGMIAVTAGDNVLRLLPPLIVDEAEIDAGLKMIAEAFEALDGGNGNE